MRLLLDTHIWLWSLLEPARLTSRVARALRSAENQLWLSPVSIWEVILLSERGRLVLPAGPEAWISEALERRPLNEAPVTMDVARELGRIALPYRDPADRLLAATARVFQLTLITADQRLMQAPQVAFLGNH